MNREIKFRAFSFDGNKMSESFGLLDAAYEGFPEPITDENGEYNTRANYEIMQSTGLLDKNGKEIFEGDILGGYNDPSVVVIESRLGFGTRKDSGIWNGSLGTWVDNNCEIIGNIYENPELLK